MSFEGTGAFGVTNVPGVSSYHWNSCLSVIPHVRCTLHAPQGTDLMFVS